MRLATPLRRGQCRRGPFFGQCGVAEEGHRMGFQKVGAPAPVASVTANCKCDLCSESAACKLVGGRFLCEGCARKEEQEGAAAGPQAEAGGQDGAP